MSEIWNLSALCRCCHADGNFKSLQIQYAAQNGVEIYSCMLKETLGIQINPPPFEASYTICDPCILKLRDATNFKNLVLSCERKFKEYCENEMSQKLNTDYIKVELDVYHEDGDSHADDHHSHDECDDKSKLNLVTCKQEFNIDIIPLATDDPKNIASKVEITLEPAVKNTIARVSAKPTSTITNSEVKNKKSKKPSLVIKKDAKITKKANVVVKKAEVKDGSEKTKSKPRIRLKRPKEEKGKEGEASKNILIKCELCESKFKFEKNLKVHILKKHTKNYKCVYCPEEFKTKNRFLIHLKIHKDDRDYKCKHCDKSFNDAFTAYEHESSHHTDPKFTCDLCKKDFKSRSSLIKHFLWHYGKNKKFLCDLCGHSFNDKTNLLKHIQSVHEKLRPFTCEVCARTFTTKRHLGTHHKKTHEATESFTCQICDKTYVTKESLQIHALKHENKFKCRHCAAIYEERSVYLSHLLMHKRNQTPMKKEYDKKIISTHIKCEICSNFFSNKYSLRRHMVVHSNVKEFTCSLCTSSFTQKNGLVRHIKRAHGPKIKKVFEKCPVCNRNSSDLKKHMRNHTDRPYMCEYCPKVYSNGSAHNRHVREVHFGTTHECDLCGKTYNLRKSLRVHKLKVHMVSWKTEIEHPIN